MRRTFISSGFVAVDVVNGESLRASPGGTATNVACAMSSLGWDSSIVGKIGDDPAGQFAHRELARAGVNVDLLILDPDWTTPVLLQERSRGDHTWRYSCPVCGTRFAKQRPAGQRYAEEVLSALSPPTVFLFDRVSRFTLTLAERWKSLGTFVVFEPATAGHANLFERAAGIADLIKFSSERAEAFASRMGSTTANVIETLGSHGLRYRESNNGPWQYLDPHPVEKLIDSSGAGDWTTAGLLDAWLKSGHSLDGLTQAADHGQILGADACGWEGALPGALREIGEDFESFACPRVVKGLPISVRA